MCVYIYIYIVLAKGGCVYWVRVCVCIELCKDVCVCIYCIGLGCVYCVCKVVCQY